MLKTDHEDYGSYIPAFGTNTDGTLHYLGEGWCVAEPDGVWLFKTKSECKAKGFAYVKEHNSQSLQQRHGA